MGLYITYSQKHMYQMAEEPPELELNGYIVEYKRTGDGYWLACFLHRFEQTILNGWAFKLCDKYGQLSHFEDIKQEMVQALLAKLASYDLTLGTTLLQFAGRDMVNAVHTYIRKDAGLFLLPDNYYKNLRKVNAIYYRNRELSPDERLKAVIRETGLSAEKALQYIEAGKEFRHHQSTESDEQPDGLNEMEAAKRTPDIYSLPEQVVLRRMLYETMVELIENLRARDRELLMDYLGIICLNCGRIGKPSLLADIADKHQLRDEQSVTKRFSRIIGELRVELEEQGWG